MKIAMADISFDEHGLVPAVVQDANTGHVLMLAYMSAESMRRTLETKETWFWSRSRSCLWHKGETSGNKQRVVNVFVDCDHDAVWLSVIPEGPACHTGEQSCFHNEMEETPAKVGREESKKSGLGDALDSLYAVIESRRQQRPEGSYTAYLFNEGLDKILKKVGEESAETIIAAKNEDASGLAREAADLLYHLVVLFVERGLSLHQISNELTARRNE